MLDGHTEVTTPLRFFQSLLQQTTIALADLPEVKRWASSNSTAVSRDPSACTARAHWSFTRYSRAALPLAN
eukprot:4319851-Lingulodinium_polyedra.AAC.1